MKYLITEQQNDYLERWKRFKILMLRRDGVIKELISKYAKRPRRNPYAILENVVDELRNTMKVDIDNEGELFDWVYLYVEDNYSGLIEEMYEDERMV